MKEVINATEQKMEKCVNALEKEFSTIRAGRANPGVLDKITVDLGSKVNGTDVMINLTDPGWCRTDLGGRYAPNAPESAIPGIVVGVFADDGRSGRCFGAQRFTGMSLEDAVALAEREFPAPY